MEKDELYLLGACLLDRAVLLDAIERLPAEAFEFDHHHELFKILRQVYRQGLDTNTSTVTKFVEDNNLIDRIGDTSLILNVALMSKSVDHEYYIRRLHENYTRRTLKKIGESIVINSDSSKDIQEYRKEVINSLSDLVDERSKDFVSHQDVFKNYKKGMNYIQYLDDYIEKTQAGIDTFEGFRTGYKQLDSLIGGFQNGTTNIIGARSSSGKTTLLCNLFINILRSNPSARIGFFTLEMNQRMIAEKLIFMVAGVNLLNVKNTGCITPDEHQRICCAAEEVNSWNLFYNDFPGMKISQIKSCIRKSISRDRTNIFFTDYLTKIQGDSKYANKHNEIDQVSKGIQEIAQEYDIPMVTLAQLNRLSTGRTDKRPLITDLRESGSIEEDADTILLMHRPKHHDTSLTEDVTEVYVAKNRHFGELGKITFSFDKGVLYEQAKIEKVIQGAMISGEEETPSKKQKDWETKYYGRNYKED